jgi:hypothetical protein
MLPVMAAMAAMQIASGYFASQNIKATAELNRDIANMNAEFAELDAYDAELEGYSAQARYQGVIDQTLGEQQAALTAADVDVNYGTNASIQEETRFIGRLNLMEIEKQAQQQALGYKRQARDFILGGDLAYSDAMFKASSAMSQGIAGAAQTGLSGYQRSR